MKFKQALILKFPRYIELQMRLPRYKSEKDLKALLKQISTLHSSLRTWKPAVFGELPLLDNFIQGVLTRYHDNHTPNPRYTPLLTPELKKRSEAVCARLRELSKANNEPSMFTSELPVALQESLMIDVGSLDEQSDALFFNNEHTSHLMECQLLGVELSQFVDITHPHDLYVSFQQALHIQERRGIYKHLSTSELYKMAQLIMVNILSRDEVDMKSLTSDAQRFFCHHTPLEPMSCCPGGLWDFAISRRRSESKRHTILLCSLLSQQSPRPTLAWVLDARLSINAKFSSQWSPS